MRPYKIVNFECGPCTEKLAHPCILITICWIDLENTINSLKPKA